MQQRRNIPPPFRMVEAKTFFQEASTWAARGDRPLPEQYIICRDIHVFQHFGRNLIETIPSGQVIVAERISHYARMIEALWEDKQYLIFERDLTGSTEPLAKSGRAVSLSDRHAQVIVRQTSDRVLRAG